MRRMALVSCSACRRHTRATEASCAFCGGALSASIAIAGPNLGALSRAALLALAVAGCNRPTETIAQAYGAPPPEPSPQLDAGAADVAQPEVPDAGMPMGIMYGAPPAAASSGSKAPRKKP